MNKLVNRLVIMGLTMLSCAAVSAQEVTVRFNLNYKTREKAPESLTLKQNNALKLQDKTIPERPGYRFAGWYTDKACTREWLFGTKSSGWMQPAVDSMSVTSSMTLYARWAKPVHIRDARDLDAIRNDLQGWYVLDNDIDLSSYEDWNPIGTYEADYEFADGEWWSTAFKGRLDGNGHAIKNLSITRLDQAKKALFGTMANGEIHDLILESPRIVLKGENPYVAPLVGVMKEDSGRQCLVENVRVNHAEIDLEVRNDTGAFVSATGLSGGTWNGTISRCAVNGSIKVLMADNGGGELYVGGFTGEPYCMTQDCVSDMDIEIVYDRGKAEGWLRSFIGGLQAGATEIRDCQSYGTIRLSGDNGKGDISVGGLIGSERYGKVADSQSYVNIDAEGVQNLRVGGIAGEFSSQYAMIGALSGVRETSIEHCFAGGSFRAKDVKDLVRGAICGSGQPETLSAWGQTMDYRLEGCTYSFSDESTEYFVVSCGGQEGLTGEWYGLRDKALITMTLDEDGTFSIGSASNSNYNIRGTYTLDESACTIDLPQTTNGMGAAGLYRINPDGTMDMNLNFGAPGQAERPGAVGPDPSSYTNTYFHLTRDKASLEAELSPKVEIPADAALAFERNKRLGAGINLNAVVDGNKHPGYERDAPLADAEIASIAEVGFKSIRLDVCWAKHASFEAPYTIDPKFFAKVDHIVDECLKNGLAVSIDQHYYPYINMSNGDERISLEDNYERLNSFWEQIAEHYKDYSDETLFYDLLNEPNMEMGADKWNEVIARLVKTIRKSNPGRTLIVATPNLGQHWTLNYLELPKDDWNLIVEFHYYLPHLFTHQGLAYAMAENSTNVSWNGTDEEKAPIISDLDYCKQWSDHNGRPLNMGEYGAINTADQESRIRYIGFMREESEKRGFSSHLWGYREPFMIRDEKTGEWIMPIVDAMKLQ